MVLPSRIMRCSCESVIMGSRVALTLVVQPVERGTLSVILWSMLGLLALVLEGVLVIFSLGAVALITSAFATRRTANYFRSLLLPNIRRSPL